MTGNTHSVKLGFWGLTAIVFGMMVGAGIYNIPQNMAAAAGLGAVMISWAVTAAGMLLLVATFKTLADRRPDLDAGIYQYAQEGWGNYAGFNIAWGYWLCTCFANVAYAVMLNDSFGAFFPAMLDSGVSEILFGSVLIWVLFLVVRGGMRTAKSVNNILAAVKVAVILIIIALIAANIRGGMFTRDFWGMPSMDCGGVAEQVRNTMLVTLWCFIGIEGAVMMSARAKNPRDVGRAGIMGFFIAWLLYILVSVMCFGIMNQRQLAGLDNPSVAYVLRESIGGWAYYLVITAVIVSLLGGWVSWTLVCAQIPYEAASVGILPRRFLNTNSHGMPTFGLIVSSAIMQVFLLLVVAAHDVYLAALSITGMMVLPAYLFSALYLWKSSLNHTSLGPMSRRRNLRFRATAIACTAFCLWMIYAGGIGLLMLTSAFYLCGLPFYLKSRTHTAGPLFTRREKAILALIILSTLVSLTLLATGHITL